MHLEYTKIKVNNWISCRSLKVRTREALSLEVSGAVAVANQPYRGRHLQLGVASHESQWCMLGAQRIFYTLAGGHNVGRMVKVASKVETLWICNSGSTVSPLAVQMFCAKNGAMTNVRKGLGLIFDQVLCVSFNVSVIVTQVALIPIAAVIVTQVAALIQILSDIAVVMTVVAVALQGGGLSALLRHVAFCKAFFSGYLTRYRSLPCFLSVYTFISYQFWWPWPDVKITGVLEG